MIVYKLTDQKMRTYRGFQWSLHKIAKTSGHGPLCSPAWLHAYEDPLLAVFHNPRDANIYNPRMFKAETHDGIILRDGHMKLGTTKLELLEEMQIPQVDMINRQAYCILCALERLKLFTNLSRDCVEKDFVKWAKAWISGKNRSSAAANDLYNRFYYNKMLSNTNHSLHAAWAAVDSAGPGANRGVAMTSAYSVYLASKGLVDLPHPKLAQEAMKIKT